MSDGPTLLSGIGEVVPRRGQQFAVVLRGYDREQVDEYLEGVDGELARLQELVAGLDARIRAQDAEHRARVERLQEEQDADRRPTYRGFGERVASILANAEREAESLRAAARRELEDARANLDERVAAEAQRAGEMARAEAAALTEQAQRDREEATEVLAAAQARAAEQEAASQARLDALEREHRQLLERLAAIRDAVGNLTAGPTQERG